MERVFKSKNAITKYTPYRRNSTTMANGTTERLLRIRLSLEYACRKNIPINAINEHVSMNPVSNKVRFTLYEAKNSTKKNSGIKYQA
jgi:hypothetical protein